MIEKTKNYIYSSPLMKTAISLLSSVAIGIFSNTLVTDLATPLGINWGVFYKSLSFYLLLLFIFLTLLFHNFLYQFEQDILKFQDNEFCMAYARSRLLPEQVEKYRLQIRDGNVDDFNKAMRDLQRVLK